MTVSSDYSYIFGPVPSRRLGHSLGIDLVPYKTCSYDCIYCQLGKTTYKTIERKEYVPLNKVIIQLKKKLQKGVHADYITLSGSGEPTLYSKTISLIERIKDITDIPVAVITNGSLLWNKSVREGIYKSDLVIPSLDAGNAAAFQIVNRPFHAIKFDTMVAGIKRFRREYKGVLWLEVFLLNGITATQAEVEDIARIANDIFPDKIQLNTVARPPCDTSAHAVPQKSMDCFAKMFEENTEVIANYGNSHGENEFIASREDVLQLISRRPCTLEDVAAGLSMHRNEALKHLEYLVTKSKIMIESTDDVYYLLPNR